MSAPVLRFSVSRYEVSSRLPLLLVMAMSWPLVASADTFHVAPPPAGSDTHPGTQGEPWATLQHAADSVAAGDTVIVHEGDYVGMQIVVSGTAGSPIAFRAASGETPRIVADNASTPDGINIEGADHIVIEGFQIDGRGRAGIRAVLCEHVTIRGNSFDLNQRWGVFTGFCDDLLIEGNSASRSIEEHGVYVSNSGDRPIIRGNRLFDNAANGVHMNGDASLGGDGVISDALVENNLIFGNGASGGSGINCDGVQNSLIRNNLIYDTHASGISLYRIDGGQPSNGNRVFNNTILVASDGRWGINVRDGSSGNSIKNNIIYSRHGFRGALSVCPSCVSGLISDHNVVEDRFSTDDGDSGLTLAQWQNDTGQDANSIALQNETALDALFRDGSGGDFRLVDGLAVDVGETLVDVPADLEGLSRPQGLAWDAGCYEGLGVVFTDGFESGDMVAWSSVSP
ncbi:MAG: right-handed parallel beta-helix repeat-containing protein [Thermoanaerobaculia bacterium]|nr:right-handed parallel beta-helix repeat-containing protein [Thermoanaerobaculia bacterium]